MKQGNRILKAAVCAGILWTVPVWGQGAEATVYGGGAHSTGSTNALAGGSIGVTPSEKLRIFGEVNYIPVGSGSSTVTVSGITATTKASAKLLNFGGGVEFNIVSKGSKWTPYVVAVAGDGRTSAKASSTGTFGSVNVSASTNSVYLGGGAGLRYAIGEHWGFKPEIRYQRYVQNGGGGILMFSGGLYFGLGK